MWLALPFGISEACRIFQTVQDALWRGLRCGRNAVLPRHGPEDARGEQLHHGVVGLSYIDDGCLTADALHDLRWMAAYVMVAIIRTGWVISWAKSCWTADRRQAIVLGVRVDLEAFVFEVTAKMRDKIKLAATEVAAAATARRRVPVRVVASFAGKVMSTFLAVGDPAYIFTKDTYTLITRAINAQMPRDGRRRWLRAAWNVNTHVSPAVREEALFQK